MSASCHTQPEIQHLSGSLQTQQCPMDRWCPGNSASGTAYTHTPNNHACGRHAHCHRSSCVRAFVSNASGHQHALSPSHTL
eukprot:888635-Rhodomonas_salina.2